jgi:hypothetical protein
MTLTSFLYLINSSRADSRVSSLKSNVSGTISVPIIRAMMMYSVLSGLQQLASYPQTSYSNKRPPLFS